MSEAHQLVYVPASLLDATGILLANFAAVRPCEGVVYWFGLEHPTHSVVTTLVVPDADTRRGDVVTSAAANAEVLGAVVGTPLVLLGQAHSHPRSDVRHSLVDDRETFAQFPGALSVVVPFFARDRMDLLRCGVHRHLGGRFVRIPAVHVSAHLRILPGIVDFRRTDRVPDGRQGSS